jgi:hypothetical protein
MQQLIDKKKVLELIDNQIKDLEVTAETTLRNGVNSGGILMILGGVGYAQRKKAISELKKLRSLIKML